MKKKFSYKDILYKGKRVAVLGLVVVFGTGVIVTSGLDKKEEVSGSRRRSPGRQPGCRRGRNRRGRFRRRF